jgi:acyl carrier protein
MNDDFLSFVSEYFSREKRLINKKTRIEALERTAHDRIVFTFELEKRYGIEFEEEELLKLKKPGDYQALLRRNFREKESSLRSGLIIAVSKRRLS